MIGLHRLCWLDQLIRISTNRLAWRVLLAQCYTGWKPQRGGHPMTQQRSIEGLTDTLNRVGTRCLSWWELHDSPSKMTRDVNWYGPMASPMILPIHSSAYTRQKHPCHSSLGFKLFCLPKSHFDEMELQQLKSKLHICAWFQELYANEWMRSGGWKTDCILATWALETWHWVHQHMVPTLLKLSIYLSGLDTSIFIIVWGLKS